MDLAWIVVHVSRSLGRDEFCQARHRLRGVAVKGPLGARYVQYARLVAASLEIAGWLILPELALWGIDNPILLGRFPSRLLGNRNAGGQDHKEFCGLLPRRLRNTSCVHRLGKPF